MGFPLATMLLLASEAVFPLLGFDRFRRDFHLQAAGFFKPPTLARNCGL
jgi:hypothetical protein